MLRFLTAGESHSPELVAAVEGVPAGFDIDIAKINAGLARRNSGAQTASKRLRQPRTQ
jgi:chorismate synthase